LVTADDHEVLLAGLQRAEERLRGAVVAQRDVHARLLVVAPGLGDVERRELDVGGVGEADDQGVGRLGGRGRLLRCRAGGEGDDDGGRGHGGGGAADHGALLVGVRRTARRAAYRVRTVGPSGTASRSTRRSSMYMPTARAARTTRVANSPVVSAEFAWTDSTIPRPRPPMTNSPTTAPVTES